MKKKDACRRLTVLLVTIVFFVCFLYPVKAEAEEVYAEYVIEEGDFLSVVSMMFNTTVDDILAINNISDVNEFFDKPVITFDEDELNNDISEYSLHDILIDFSIREGKVFDVSTREFTSVVINSSKTDEEILIATIDLIGLLISGNQMVITQKHNFE